MSRARSIAAVQTVPVRGDVAANLDEHLRLAGRAADEGARIAVFPELSLTGYELDLAGDLAFTPDDPRLAPLLALAAERAIALVVGAPVRLDGRLHLAALIVAPDRSVEVYTKRHLGAFDASASSDGVVPPPESSVFEPGSRDPLLRTGGATAAVAVCADTGRPSHPQRAADRGADTYLASAFVIPADYERDASRLAAHARRHAMAVALANYGGPTGGLPAAGRSAIWSETGERLVQVAASGPALALAREEPTGWRGWEAGR